MKWINFLHLYQPANADARVIEEATEKSYLRIIRALEEHPRARLTLNIAGCLFSRWEESGRAGIPARLRALLSSGRLELTASAAYHPILPLISKNETISQIKENEKILKRFFEKTFKLKGFYFPEMAYSAETAKIVKALGYEWIILDEFSKEGVKKKIDYKKRYLDKNSGLKIVFRSRAMSSKYPPDAILRMLDGRKEKSKGKITVTASDGELYGLRHNDPTARFEKLFDNENLKTLTVSDYLEEIKNNEEEKVTPVASTWETTEEDLKNNNPYPLWHDKNNEIQMKIWELANFACGVVEKNKKDKNYHWARWHLVRGLASCTFWWASGKDFKKIFGPVSWSPDEIERGTNEFIRAVRSLENPNTIKDKIEAEKIYMKIRRKVWEKHWTYYWKK